MKKPMYKMLSVFLAATLLALSAVSISTGTVQAATGTAACTAGGLAAAISASPAGGTITYAADCTITLAGEITFPSSTTTIDANGHIVVLTAAANHRLFTIPATATVILRNLTLTGGQVTNGAGGAIYNTGNLTIENSTIRNNTATGSSYTNGVGGAIYSSGPSLTIRNSTFVYNTATYYGSAIYVEGGTNTLTHVTIANNNAVNQGGAIHVHSIEEEPETIHLQNSILANNTGNNCGVYPYGGDATISNEGGNVNFPSSDYTCGSEGYATESPNLSATLAYNGSATTQTLAILEVPSSAIDYAVETYCLPYDQRGAVRESPCDSGAYEYGARMPSTTTLTSTTPNPSVYGTAITLTATVSPIPASGSVTFTEGATTLGSAAVNTTTGAATITTSVKAFGVGAHTITATFSGDDISAPSSGTLERNVTARPVSVNADAKTKVYGETDPALTYQVTSGTLVSGDSFSGQLSRAPGTAVGTYAITQNTLTLGSNYAITYVGSNLTITTRPVTVTADAKTRVYGETDPVLTYQITSGSLVSGDSFTGQLGRAPGDGVGTYAITRNTLALNANYTLTYVGANLTITARPVTVAADSKSRVYGETDPALTYRVTSGSVVSGDTFSGELARASGNHVGTYAITQNTLTLGPNYTITYIGANLTITARPITITADPKTKMYGEADPALTYQVTSGSLVSGDSFTGALGRMPGENIGSRAILQNTLALSSDYTFTYVGANLTITVRPVTVTADAKTRVYGDPDPALTYQITSGSLAQGDSFSGALSRAPGPGVGTYAIEQNSLALNSNYNLTYVGANFVITARLITVTVDAKTKVYGDADPALTYQVTSGSLASGDGFSGALSRAVGENAGSYAILQNTLALNSNYNLTYIGANLVITPAPLTITADDKSKLFGEDNPPLTYKIDGLKNGDSEDDLGGVPAISTTAGKLSGGGVYPITVTVGTLSNASYTFTFVNGTLTIIAHQMYLPTVQR